MNQQRVRCGNNQVHARNHSEDCIHPEKTVHKTTSFGIPYEYPAEGEDQYNAECQFQVVHRVTGFTFRKDSQKTPQEPMISDR
jgi:hypothetical protein